jgi:hypothetical protein
MQPIQPPTHLAVPLAVAKSVRQVLGGMPYDQVRDLLAAFDNSPTVSINAPVERKEENSNGESDKRH